MMNQTHIMLSHAGVIATANENGFFWKDLKNTKTEIPVSNFIDLLNDSIVPWRLELDGFVFYESTGQHILHTNGLKRYHVTLPPMSNTVKVDAWDGDKGITADGITTYTELITLIRLIG
jgi:hypothetical protein